MQGSLYSVHPENDKFAIILKPQSPPLIPNSIAEGSNPPEKKEERKFIGLIGTHDDAQELVYMLHCDYWRKGYMSEAMIALLGPDGLVWKLESLLTTL
jgi:RimJ/RimL family protein N-acetyltransferase